MITITPLAAKYLANLLTIESPNHKLRILVDSGGCSGLQYIFSVTDLQNAEDLLIVQDGAAVLIDNLSKQYMEGCTIDLIDNLSTTELEITNPKAIANCGCGNSFAV